MLVVINTSYRGYSLSIKAQAALMKLGWSEEQADNASWCNSDPDFRSHPDLVQVVDELGPLSWGEGAELKIVEIPDEPTLRWEIVTLDFNDGTEFIQEVCRTCLK